MPRKLLLRQPKKLPQQPSSTPTEEPSSTPTEEPSSTPTEKPSSTPTEEPSSTPTEEPSSTPTEEPSSTPTIELACVPTSPIFSGFFDLDLMGCTTEEARLVNHDTYQRFEKGFMIHDTSQEQALIILFDESNYELGSFENKWEKDMGQYACEEAESAGGAKREFSLVWCQNPDIRETLGNRIQDEIANPMTIQAAQKPILIYIPPRLAKVALREDNTFVSEIVAPYPAPEQ